MNGGNFDSLRFLMCQSDVLGNHFCEIEVDLKCILLTKKVKKV